MKNKAIQRSSPQTKNKWLPKDQYQVKQKQDFDNYMGRSALYD